MRLFCRTLVIPLLLLTGCPERSNRPYMVPVQAQSVEAQQSSLRILFVGNSPEELSGTPTYVSSDEAKRYLELKKERTEAFTKFLEQYFETVKVVVSDEYKIKMSAEYDVTVFDAKPPVVKTIPQPKGLEKKIRLPDDFSYPALMVGEVGPLSIGRFGNDFLIDHL